MTNVGRTWQWASVLAITLAVICGGLHGQELKVAMGDSGITSLRHGQTELLGDGEFRVTGAFFRKPSGDVYAADLAQGRRDGTATAATTRTGNPATAAVRAGGPGCPAIRFPWGIVAAAYRQEGNNLEIDILVQIADDGDELVGLYVQPLTLKFPAAPAFENRSWLFYMSSTMGHNLGAPGFVGARWDQGTLAVCNEQIVRPLAAGFGPPAADAKTTYPVLAYSSRHPMAKEKFPWIDRPVAPGAWDQWRITLRLAPAGTAYNELVKDLYGRFAEAFPYELKWEDRRPIAQCMLSSSAQGWKTNPRGWHHGFGAGKLDIAAEAGKEAFKKDLLAYADRTIAIAKEIDAQGLIVWDTEGQEQPHMISYLGDPRSLPPEMRLTVGDGNDAKPVVDVFYRKLRDAGLRTGICIRPQRPMRPTYDEKVEQVGWPDHGSRAANVSAKIKYAKERWGCTIFYLDSDVVWAGDPVPIPGAGGYSATTDAQLLRDVLKAHPDVLILPEWEDLRCYAYAAPYTQLNYNKLPCPPDYVLLTYPRAFFVNRVGVKDGQEHQPALVEAVKRGDVLFYTGWYGAAENTLVKDIYRAAGKGAASQPRSP